MSTTTYSALPPAALLQPPPPDICSITPETVYPKGYTIPEGWRKADFKFVQPGESYLHTDGSLTAPKVVSLPHTMPRGMTIPQYPRIIIKPLRSSVEEAYVGPVPAIPAGYYAGELETVQSGRQYLDMFGEVVEYHKTATIRRIRLHRIPTVEDIYGLTNPYIPSGWKAGEVKRPGPEDTYLGVQEGPCAEQVVLPTNPYHLSNTVGDRVIELHEEFRLVLKKGNPKTVTIIAEVGDPNPFGTSWWQNRGAYEGYCYSIAAVSPGLAPELKILSITPSN